MKDSFDISLLDSRSWVKKGYSLIVANVGKAIAVITLAAAALVFFTEITFSGINAESFTGTLALLLAASYIMYFSLEDAGEKLGRDTEEYKAAKEGYSTARARVRGEDIEALRDFCLKYREKEHEYRKNNLIFSHGYTLRDYEGYKAGRCESRKMKNIFSRIDRLRPAPLSAQDLLGGGIRRDKEELRNPDSRKLLSMLTRLLPSTVCMFLTVSVMINVKDGMSFADVAEGILRLSTLPIIGLKGYTAGYEYAVGSEIEWMETKTKLLCAFFSEREKHSA